MIAIEKIILDSRAKKFVHEHLDKTNILCRELLTVIQGAAGEFFTIAPANTNIERIYQFDAGGLLPVNHGDSRDDEDMMPIQSLFAARSKRIISHTAKIPPVVCIVDDATASWNDPYSCDVSNAFGVGEEIYYLLSSSSNLAEIEEVLCRGNSIWHGVAAVCEYRPLISKIRECSIEELAKSAQSVIEVSCMAYDGEGFVGWRRT